MFVSHEAKKEIDVHHPPGVSGLCYTCCGEPISIYKLIKNTFNHMISSSRVMTERSYCKKMGSVCIYPNKKKSGFFSMNSMHCMTIYKKLNQLQFACLP